MSTDSARSCLDLKTIKEHYGAELHICVERSGVSPFARDTNADFQWLISEVERLQTQLTDAELLLRNNQVRREEVEARHGVLLRRLAAQSAVVKAARECSMEQWQGPFAEMRVKRITTKLSRALARLDAADVPHA